MNYHPLPRIQNDREGGERHEANCDCIFHFRIFL